MPSFSRSSGVGSSRTYLSKKTSAQIDRKKSLTIWVPYGVGVTVARSSHGVPVPTSTQIRWDLLIEPRCHRARRSVDGAANWRMSYEFHSTHSSRYADYRLHTRSSVSSGK
jgi:hypothetical protein